jgi:hypothetical protein
MEIESHNSDDGHYEPIVNEENYSFLPKKSSKSSKPNRKINENISVVEIPRMYHTLLLLLNKVF